MKEFMNPQVNVLKYTLADVIATSGGGLINGGHGTDTTGPDTGNGTDTGGDFFWSEK